MNFPGPEFRELAVCDRCGFTHSIDQLRKQNGLLVCTGAGCGHHCYDDLTVERRPFIIAKILNDGAKEGVKEGLVILQEEVGELPTF